MTLRYKHLLGRQFVHGQNDCYSIVRNFYLDNFDIHLTDFSRSDFWWLKGQNLYMDLFAGEGFELVHIAPHQAQPADVLLVAFDSEVPNHAGVFLGLEGVLHHFQGRLSAVVPLKGIWRNNVCAIVRHKNTVLPQPPPVNLKSILDAKRAERA